MLVQLGTGACICEFGLQINMRIPNAVNKSVFAHQPPTPGSVRSNARRTRSEALAVLPRATCSPALPCLHAMMTVQRWFPQLGVRAGQSLRTGQRLGVVDHAMVDIHEHGDEALGCL